MGCDTISAMNGYKRQMSVRTWERRCGLPLAAAAHATASAIEDDGLIEAFMVTIPNRYAEGLMK